MNVLLDAGIMSAAPLSETHEGARALTAIETSVPTSVKAVRLGLWRGFVRSVTVVGLPALSTHLIECRLRESRSPSRHRRSTCY